MRHGTACAWALLTASVVLVGLVSSCFDFDTAQNEFCDAGGTYCTQPVILSVDPVMGLGAGGTPVVIRGSGFANVDEVSIGASPLSQMTVVNDQKITGITAPSLVGLANVTVKSPFRTATRPLAFTFVSGHTDGGTNYVFVTSMSVTPGTLGSVSAADQICRNLAADGGLPGRYVAWLPSSTQTALQRIGDARSWYRPDGRPSIDLIGAPVAFAPSLTEHGQPWNGYAFTGTTASGGTAASCSFWTASTGTIRVGVPSSEGSQWTDLGDGAFCNQPAPFYCLGVDQSLPLRVPAPDSSRIAFVTVGSFFPRNGGLFPQNGGLGAADAQCQDEAQRSGLMGTFKAFLATSTTSAANRFSASGPNWYRLDHVPLFASPSALLAASTATTPLATPSLSAGGGSLAGVPVWTGAAAPSVIGGTETCSNWTSNSGSSSGTTGMTGLVESGWFSNGPVPCSSSAHLYCLQQ